MAHAARPLSSTGSNICKSVQFSRFIKISFTYPEDEYDRSALEPAKLTFSEASELLALRVHWRQEMNSRLEASDKGHADSNGFEHDNDDGRVPDSSECSPLPSSSSSSSSSHRRLLPPHHSLLKPTCGSQGLTASPPCSPVLSHQDSCSNSSSDDEYDPSLSPQHPLSLSVSQQRLKKIPSAMGSTSGGMMHHHSHLDRKDNVQCLA